MKTHGLLFGILITFAGGVLWGFSGVCGQFLFMEKGVGAKDAAMQAKVAEL